MYSDWLEKSPAASAKV